MPDKRKSRYRFALVGISAEASGLDGGAVVVLAKPLSLMAAVLLHIVSFMICLPLSRPFLAQSPSQALQRGYNDVVVRVIAVMAVFGTLHDRVRNGSACRRVDGQSARQAPRVHRRTGPLCCMEHRTHVRPTLYPSVPHRQIGPPAYPQHWQKGAWITMIIRTRPGESAQIQRMHSCGLRTA